MSQARITTVGKAQKDQGPCGNCREEIKAGDPYLWFKVGFRSRHKNVRCMKASCFPRPSQRESSLLSEVYSAQESLDAALADTSDLSLEDVTQAYEEFVEAVREYANSRREASDAWENGNSQFEEAADEAESALSDIEDWTAEEYDGDEDDAEALAEFVREQADAALESAGQLSL